jgi:SAM-dependent methyltransferase
VNLLHRIKCRIRDEGYFRTVKYFFCALHYSLRELFFNLYLDLRYSGKLLTGNEPSEFRHLGAHDVYHTVYTVMRLIFRLIEIKKSDVLVDVGCGKGRVINYWLSKNIKNKIIGLEIDPDIAMRTASQFSRYGNVSIIAGDATSNIPPDATVFYFYNPFSAEKVKQFERVLHEMFKNKPIIIIYYNPKSLHAFENGNWLIENIDFEKDLGKKRWGRINRFHELSIIRNKAVCAL